MSVGFFLFSRLPTLIVHVAQQAARRRGRDQKSDDMIRNILIIRLDNLGDVVMSTPMFREIKQHYPHSKLTVIVQDRCRSIVETNPFADRVLGIEPVARTPFLVNFLSLLNISIFYFRHLQRIPFDVVLHPRLGDDAMNESLLIALIDAPQSIGYDNERGGRLEKSERTRVLTQVLPLPFPQSEVFSNAAVVSALTGIRFSPKTELFLDADDLVFAAHVFHRFPTGNRVIALGFGATIGRRQWPAERWTETLNLLARYHPLSVLILATQSESEEASRISVALDACVEVLVDRSVREVAACIAKSDLFLGTDSGIAHVASAVQAPVVVVSPHAKNGDPAHYNSPLRFAPFGERVVVVNPGAATPPCSDSCKYQNAHCILQVTTREVIQACLDQLGESLR